PAPICMRRLDGFCSLPYTRMASVPRPGPESANQTEVAVLKRYNHLALTVVMMMMGVLLIVGSVLASISTTLFPFDQFVGTRAPVAGVAFGSGIMLAAMKP